MTAGTFRQLSEASLVPLLLDLMRGAPEAPGLPLGCAPLALRLVEVTTEAELKATAAQIEAERAAVEAAAAAQGVAPPPKPTPRPTAVLVDARSRWT